MAQPLDYVEYLSKEIGARPAGTEEEQQAALYIADEFQEVAGFNATIEDFTSSSNLEGGRAILSMITIVVSILAMLFNILTIPALVLALIAAVVYVLEAYDKPIVSSRLSRGASQNVVAKYQPALDPQAEQRGARQRKIVLVAHYDTGKVTPGIIQRAESMNLPLAKVSLAGMVAAPFFLLLRLFLGGTGGVGLIFINLLTIIAIILVAMPIIKAVLYRIAPYNEGANNNATGVAALLEIAQRINSGSMSEADLSADGVEPTVHGEQAARAEGLIPEGVELTYDVEMTDEQFDDASEEERLLAAKAAIAALTGRPVDQHIYAVPAPREQDYEIQEDPYAQNVAYDVASETQAPVVESAFAPIDYTVASAPADEDTAGFENAPSWFIAAQKNAKKSESAQPVQKSRYAEAIQAAEEQMAARERAREEEEQQQRLREQLERDAASRAALSAIIESPEAVQQTVEEVEIPAAAPQDVYEPLDDVVAPAIAEEPDYQIDAAYQESSAPALDTDAHYDDAPEARTLEAELPATASDTDEKPEFVADESLQKPGLFEDRIDAMNDMHESVQEEVEEAVEEEVEEETVDLGQTIAYSPAMLRQAIQDELQSENDGEDGEEQAIEDETESVEEAAEEPASNSARLRLKDLPSVHDEPSAQEGVPETTNPSRSGLFRMLRSDVPSLSGVISPVPVSDSMREALLKSSQLPKIVVEGDHSDVDYSMEIPVVLDKKPVKIDVPAVFEDQEDELAATSRSVEVPKSRAAGFVNRLREKEGAELNDTPQEWLDVDEDFEAREVGRERGSWESFRDADEANGEDSKRTWEGGAFSRIRLGHVNTRSGVEEEDDSIQEAVEAAEDQELNEEIEQIYHFRNPDFNAEIWFVAIGSDTELHDGAHAFLEEHKQELRGAMVIELESLGVGELCVASEEGQFRKMQASSRIKRFTRGASEVTGIVLGQVKLATDSITTVVQKSGMQAMHLLGVEDGRPALKGSADDILENVDELIFEENINYIVELLKQD